MDQFVINASTRTGKGKKYAKSLRAKGKIPAVAYNENGEAFSLEIDSAEFEKIWRTVTRTTRIVLKIDGNDNQAFIKDTEYDIKTDKVLHADFHIVTGQKKLTYKYKIRCDGKPAGVLKGGFMVKHTTEIKLRAFPLDLPEYVSADVSGLEIGQKFSISDFSFGDKVDILSDLDAVVVHIAPPKNK